MGFRYTRAAPAQHVLLGVELAVMLGIGWSDWGRAQWRVLAEGYSDFVLLAVGPLVLHLLVFWPLAAAFHYVDTHDAPAWVARHRIQSGKRRQPETAKVMRVLATNQLLLSPLMLVLLSWMMCAMGWTVSPELPSLPTVLLEMALMAGAAAVFFYASHRFLHRPWWMKRVHRVHHEFRTTSAVAAEYAHPVEFLLANFGTLAVGIPLVFPSLPAVYMFTVLSVTHIVVHHSGYAVPWAPWSVPHDWHHYRYKELFGTVGVLDRLLGTDQEFRNLRDGDQV
jgi:methylsterol monooxygenase